MGSTHAADRALETARELRAAAEDVRRTILESRNIVQKSREQTRAIMTPPVTEANDQDVNQIPSEKLVHCLIRAYELAVDEGDVRTQNQLGSVLHDVGSRIAAEVGPKATQMILH